MQISKITGTGKQTIEALKYAVESMNPQDIEQLEADVSELGDELNTLSQDVVVNTTNIADITQDVATNAADIAMLQVDKQNTLTAGANITITNDVISATGGGSTGFYGDMAKFAWDRNYSNTATHTYQISNISSNLFPGADDIVMRANTGRNIIDDGSGVTVVLSTTAINNPPSFTFTATGTNVHTISVKHIGYGPNYTVEVYDDSGNVLQKQALTAGYSNEYEGVIQITSFQLNVTGTTPANTRLEIDVVKRLHT